MKYLLLIYGNEEKWASIPEDDLGEKIAEQDAWNQHSGPPRESRSSRSRTRA